MFTRGSPFHGIRKTAWEPLWLRGAPKKWTQREKSSSYRTSLGFREIFSKSLRIRLTKHGTADGTTRRVFLGFVDNLKFQDTAKPIWARLYKSSGGRI